MTSTPAILPINNPLSLYAIMQEHLTLLQQVLEADGEVTPDMEEALLFNGQEMQKKSMSVAYAIKTLEYNADILDKEIDRLQSLKTKAIKARKFFKQRLSEAMQLYGIERLDGGNMKLFFRKSDSVDIIDAGLLTDDFLKYPPPEPMKSKIKAAIKAGEEVPGAQLITKQNLQIK
jgi:hypothetical protein